MHGIFGLTMLVLILKAIPLTRFAKAEFVYCINVSIDLSLYLEFRSNWAKRRSTSEIVKYLKFIQIYALQGSCKVEEKNW